MGTRILGYTTRLVRSLKWLKATRARAICLINPLSYPLLTKGLLTIGLRKYFTSSDPLFSDLVRCILLTPRNYKTFTLNSQPTSNSQPLKRVYFNNVNIVHNLLVKYYKQNVSLFFFKTERVAFSAETLCKKIILECRRTRGSTFEFIINDVLDKALTSKNNLDTTFKAFSSDFEDNS
jgi:hypothetical protein